MTVATYKVVTGCCHLEGERQAGLQDHAAGAAKARVTPAERLRLHMILTMT